MVDPSHDDANPPPAATDSPWFWAMLFSTAALIGLVAIAPKYAVRHDRVQRQFEGRQEAWGRRAEAQADPHAARRADRYVDVSVRTPGFSVASQTGLWVLFVVLVILVVVTTVAWRRAVWRQRFRTIRYAQHERAARHTQGGGDGVAL